MSSTRSNTTDSSGRTPLSEKSITCSDKEPLEDDDDAHEDEDDNDEDLEAELLALTSAEKPRPKTKPGIYYVIDV